MHSRTKEDFNYLSGCLPNRFSQIPRLFWVFSNISIKFPDHFKTKMQRMGLQQVFELFPFISANRAVAYAAQRCLEQVLLGVKALRATPCRTLPHRRVSQRRAHIGDFP